MQYIPHERFFMLMATHGDHRFFEGESSRIRDARRVPIKFAGYSMSFRGGRSSVRIDKYEYQSLVIVQAKPQSSLEISAGGLWVSN